MKPALITIAVIVNLSCVPVAGRLRPAWSPVWSTVQHREISTGFCGTGNLKVTVFFESLEQPLPGAQVSASLVDGRRPEHPHTGYETTNEQGTVELFLDDGVWKIRAELEGIHPVERTVAIEAGTCYVVQIYSSGRRTREPIVVAGNRGLTPGSS